MKDPYIFRYIKDLDPDNNNYRGTIILLYQVSFLDDHITKWEREEEYNKGKLHSLNEVFIKCISYLLF